MLATSQQAQMLLANFWQNACDKSETCGENVNGETQEAAKALLHGSSRQGKYREHICLEHFIFKMSPQNGHYTSVHGKNRGTMFS